MGALSGPEQLREMIRILERKLGMLDEMQLSCCCGISFTQCHAMVELGRAGALSLNDLSETLGLDKSTMSRAIDNLVCSGLVERGQGSEDRRYVRIGLTESGREVYRVIEETMHGFFDRVYGSIPEEKRNQVLQSLGLLVKAMLDSGCC